MSQPKNPNWPTGTPAEASNKTVIESPSSVHRERFIVTQSDIVPPGVMTSTERKQKLDKLLDTSIRYSVLSMSEQEKLNRLEVIVRAAMKLVEHIDSAHANTKFICYSCPQLGVAIYNFDKTLENL